jgi:uncharacterized membrane protein
MALAPYLGQSLAVQVHLVAALLAVGLGAAQFVRRKGSSSHRAIGYAWVALMLTVALSSFWITGHAGRGQLSVIHGLSAFVLAMLALAIWSIRAGRVRMHRLTMIGVCLGGLAAGAGAFLPGRLISQILGYA